MGLKKRNIPTQPLTGKDYALIAASMTMVGLVLLSLFAFLVSRFASAETLARFFYIVLIVWGVICAVALFGVMKSYAYVRYRRLGSVVEVGGPAAFALLVVLGGFWLVPHSELFTLTIRPHGSGAPLITSGKIRVELENFAPTQEISPNGEADFKGVPYRYVGTTVRVLPLVEGYVRDYQEVKLQSTAVDINLIRLRNPFKLRIVPAPRENQTTAVHIEGEDGWPAPDRDGALRFFANKEPGQSARVTVCADKRIVFDDYVHLDTGEIEIPTHGFAGQCNN